MTSYHPSTTNTYGNFKNHVRIIEAEKQADKRTIFAQLKFAKLRKVAGYMSITIELKNKAINESFDWVASHRC